MVRRECPGAWTGRAGDDLRLWEDPAFAANLGGAWWLVARRGDDVVGTWLAPVEETSDGLVARRPVRALPYAAPRVVEAHPKRRREIWRALISYLQSECVGLELPLAPGICDYGVFSELGAFLEVRQTHCVRPPGLGPDQLTAKARNAIAAAAANTHVDTSHTVDRFDFDAAIVGAPPEHVRIRRELAKACAGLRGCLMVEARLDDLPIGQVLALHDSDYALMMHAWRNPIAGVRGVPSLLIHRLAEHVFAEKGLGILDLEGSILASVDHFMDGLGATPTPYAIAYWYPDRATLLRRLEESMDIPGRYPANAT